MSTRASATRYARALFDIVSKDAGVEQAERDLSAFVDLVESHDELRAVLSNPAVPAARKRAIVEELLSRLALLTPAVAKLLLLLADRDRLVALSDVRTVYRERLRAHQGVIEAELTTASPISDERLSEFRARLATATGRHVTLTTSVDPTLIGGVVTRIGTTVYDGSLATQLQRMKQQLLPRR